jgi:redox-sensitive bicupin YhaK (pirin superfamily)
VAQRRNALCVVASTDGRKGSLRIHQDALVCSSILDSGNHLVHELVQGRRAWLHIIYGEATLNDIVLTQGDGVGVTNEPSVSLTVQENTELLLVDLGPVHREHLNAESSHSQRSTGELQEDRRRTDARPGGRDGKKSTGSMQVGKENHANPEKL